MSKWVTAWGLPTTFIEEPVGNMLDNTTFRHTFYSPINSEKIRLNFSNAYGTEGVEISKATISEGSVDGTVIDLSTEKTVTFSDNGNVVEPQKELLSDAVDFTLKAGKTYIISLYFEKTTRLITGYNKPTGDTITRNWFVRGDYTETAEISPKKRCETRSYVCLCGIDAYTADESTHAIMAFGDSITARPWPDYLARKINEQGITNISVIRKAIGGNRVLRDYRDCLYRRRMGYAGVERFEMSLKQISGVDRVIMLEGINDICHPMKESLFCKLDQLPTAEELISGYKYCCDIAHKYGCKFYLGTILPTPKLIDSGDDRWKIWEEVNEWIRTTNVIDGFIEFSKAMADEDRPFWLKDEYDSGDTLHPNPEGSKKLCDTVPEEYYK